MVHIHTESEAQLVAQLRQIVDNQFAVTHDADSFEVAMEILDHLGSPDPELRDKLGYCILANWIPSQMFTSQQLREIAYHCISDEMLFWQIGEVHSHSVFKRSFSSLIIALILYRDNFVEAMLTHEEYQTIQKCLTRYADMEMDLRGYVSEYGWAHAAAHISDGLDECVKHRYATTTDCEMVWGSLRSLVEHADMVFVCEEDERIAVPLRSMVTRGLVAVRDLCSWIEQAKPSSTSSLADLTQNINWKNILRSLYFGLKKSGNLDTHDDVSLLQLQGTFYRG
jgi:hypothetical protein